MGKSISIPLFMKYKWQKSSYDMYHPSLMLHVTKHMANVNMMQPNDAKVTEKTIIMIFDS